jgi:hypothetical protein
MLYFQRFGTIIEARIIRDKVDNTHKGCAFIRCMYFHEAELILKTHKVKSKDKHSNKDKSSRNHSKDNKKTKNDKTRGINHRDQSVSNNSEQPK